MKAYSLICHRDVSQALLCLGSFQAMCDDDIQLQLFDDGSLTEKDTHLLCDQLSLSTSDIHHIQDIPQLTPYPYLQKARTRFVMCRKLLDIPLIDDAPKLLLDTDMLFLRAFHGITDAAEKYSFVCMRDQQSAYSPKLITRLKLRTQGSPLISHANAGFLLIDPKIIDLERLEYFFSNDNHLVFPALVEQTAWALMAAQTSTPQYWEPRAIAFPPSDLQVDASTIGWHFASDYRGLLSKASVPAPSTQPSALLKTTPAPHMSLVEEFQRACRRVQSIFKA
ncbi:hypothetical protein [Cerasicoccus maritimus]|uniref:hypothetical protein n=1 Tax=Cerasicoccus maritimus TaxID=490089 RepID=UPI002852BBAE|nr:hypothetical protein [Cerasicoccus maritimus]